jgi:hypothetical protein
MAKLEDGRYADILQSTCIFFIFIFIFLGTPHRGSSATTFPQVLANIVNATLTSVGSTFSHFRSDLLKQLTSDSDFLMEIAVSFVLWDLDTESYLSSK